MKFSTIAVHDAQFHADDLFAVAVLLEVAAKRGYDEPKVSRLRKPEDIDKQDVVLDVGGIYDPEKMRFDHHQAGYNEKRSAEKGDGISYASFGLVWKHFGQELCSQEIHDRVDKKLVQPIDAHDTGETLLCEYKNGIHPLFLRDMLYRHRPLWDESFSNESFDRGFFDALVEARSMLKRVIEQEESQIAANKIVKEAYEIAVDKRIIEISNRLPFEEQIVKYEEPLFVIMKDVVDRWLVRAISVTGFEVRKSFPKEWSGVFYLDFEKMTGVEGALSCLKGAVVTAKTREAAYKLASLALVN